jgi:SH3-like domain-containing protein
MKKFTVLSVSAALACAAVNTHADSLAQAAPAAAAKPAVATGDTGVVRADRVNVRARPDKKSEIVTQLNKGDTVVVIEKQGEWVKVRPPEKAKCYVSSKHLQDGVSTTENLNIRCGPGTNFKDIGKLAKGDKVEVVKTTGEWSQIKPTEKCAVFIAAEFVEISTPLPPPPVVTTTELTPPPVVTAVPVVPVAPVAKPVEPEVLVQVLLKDGIFASVTETNAPAKYELLTQDVSGRQYRMDFLDMSEVDKDMKRYEDKHVRVYGTERWRKGDRYPVMTVKRIDIVW